MSHGQNVLFQSFGISGNLAKLVFAKISPAVLRIRNQDALNFCNPNFLQNFAKIPQICSEIAKNSTKKYLPTRNSLICIKISPPPAFRTSPAFPSAAPPETSTGGPPPRA